MMRPLDLDLRSAPRRPRVADVLLLFAATAALGATVSLQRDADERRQAAQQVVAATPGAARGPTRSAAPPRLELDEAARQLALPWGEMLTAVESATAAEIALLSVRPAVARSEVQISGEARRYDDILNFAGRLEASPGFGRVVLTRHEVLRDNPAHPVQFVLQAEWRVAR
jgi:hypothetical protein